MKITRIRRFSHLLIISRGDKNRTYIAKNTPIHQRRISNMLERLITEKQCIVRKGSTADRFDLTVTANIKST